MRLTFFKKNKYALINALKTALAMLLAYFTGLLFGKIFHIQIIEQWMVITVFVTMPVQPNLGGVLNRALMRLLGTVVGGLIAILIILFFKDRAIELLISIPLVIISIYFTVAVPKFSYAMFLAGLTLAIVIFEHNTSIEIAITRVFEIALGVVIVLIVNRFIFPIRAKVRLRYSYANTILQIREFFNVSFSTNNHSNKTHKNLTKSIFEDFVKQINLLKEIKHEDSAKVVKEYEKMGLYIRRLHRCTIIMYEYLENSTDKRIIGTDEEEAFAKFRQSIIKSLTTVSEHISKHKKITHKQLLNSEKDIIPFLNKIKLLRDNEHFVYYTNTFILNLRKTVIEYNYISRRSKH